MGIDERVPTELGLRTYRLVMSETYNKKETAERYDSARELPEETLASLALKLNGVVRLNPVSRVLDLGGGTGRFTELLGRVLDCPVIVLDPSEPMLKRGLVRGLKGVDWIRGSGERIPVRSGSVDLVWMSQVFHHLDDRILVFKEISRVLRPKGYLLIRNGTRENDTEIEWYKYFPEARRLDDGQIPTRREITNFSIEHGFELQDFQTIYQLFASSGAEYYDKISQRGLSSLISISDQQFNAGLERLKEWAAVRPPGPVYEPVDLFVFRGSNSNPR
jgi:ubiquinone/menaquinone biosynthesis C-methylase UbiE